MFKVRSSKKRKKKKNSQVFTLRQPVNAGRLARKAHVRIQLGHLVGCALQGSGGTGWGRGGETHRTSDTCPTLP